MFPGLKQPSLSTVSAVSDGKPRRQLAKADARLAESIASLKVVAEMLVEAMRETTGLQIAAD